MKRIPPIVVMLLLFAVPSFGQTDEPAGPKIWSPSEQRWVQWESSHHTNSTAKSESIAPQEGQLYASFGPAVVVGRGEFPDLAGFKNSTVTRYGGYGSIERFVTRSVSLQGSVAGISEAVEATDGGFHASATAYQVGLDGKLYPLQLGRPNQCRAQPYIIAGIAGLFFDVSNNGGVSASIDPMAIGEAGVGTDILISYQWAVMIDAMYYHSLANSDARVSGVGSTPLELSGVAVRVGARFRFW